METSRRFQLVSPLRWFFHPAFAIPLAVFPLLGAAATWFGHSTIEDHGSVAAMGYWTFFGIFEVLWIVGRWRSTIEESAIQTATT
jgi:hypothetical protein